MKALAIGFACIFALAGCTTLSSPKKEMEMTMPSLMDASICWEKALLVYDRKALIPYDSQTSKRIYRCLVNKGYIRMPKKRGVVDVTEAEILTGVTWHE